MNSHRTEYDHVECMKCGVRVLFYSASLYHYLLEAFPVQRRESGKAVLRQGHDREERAF